MKDETKINIYNSILVDGSGIDKCHLPIATIKYIIDNNKEVIEFKYTKEWLAHKDCYPITPLLPLSNKKYIEDAYHENFSIFRDYEENSWVESLLDMKEKLLLNKVPTKRAINVNYLLSIDDYLGIDDLHFRKHRSTCNVNYGSYSSLNFQNSNDFVNKVVYMEGFLHKDTSLTEKEKTEFLSELIRYACGLGGTSEKNCTRDSNNELWIERFSFLPTEEAIPILLVAKLAGLNIPSFKIYYYKNDFFLNSHSKKSKVLENTYIFQTKRFDRDGDKKIPFATANSLLGNEYKVASSTRHSYLELAQFITKHGDIPDLEELWKRMVFNICIGNRDDSLYKHGFLYKDGKWRLSPLYGVKFSVDCISKEKGLGLNIDNTHAELDLALELAFKVIKHFRVPEAKAKLYIKTLLLNICYIGQKLINALIIDEYKIAKYEECANNIKISDSDMKDTKGNPNRGSNGRFKKKD